MSQTIYRVELLGEDGWVTTAWHEDFQIILPIRTSLESNDVTFRIVECNHEFGENIIEEFHSSNLWPKTDEKTLFVEWWREGF